MDILQQLEAHLARIEAKLDDLLRRTTTKPSPHLTVAAFAKAAGVSRNTIHRHLNEKMLRKERGRIPAKYLQNYVTMVDPRLTGAVDSSQLNT